MPRHSAFDEGEAFWKSDFVDRVYKGVRTVYACARVKSLAINLLNRPECPIVYTLPIMEANIMQTRAKTKKNEQ